MNSQFPKIFDRSDPRVCDIENYDINSFEIGSGHKCPGTEFDVYIRNCKRQVRDGGRKVI